MIEIKVSIDDPLFQEFKKIPIMAVKELDKAIKLAAMEIRNIAVKNISQGQRHGVIYKKAGKIGQRSAPGEYPKTDTGRLVGSIRTDFEFLSASVGSDVNYSEFLEKGTRKMKPRPWLQPSFDLATPKIQEIIDRALERAFKL